MTATSPTGTLSGDGAYVLYNRLYVANHISFTVKTSNNWDKFGISFVRGSDSKKYYTMVVNPEWEDGRKVNFEQEGEEGKGFIEAADGYVFQRPADNVYNIDIYTDNSVLTMYINDVCAYTQRIYGIQKNCWSILIKRIPATSGDSFYLILQFFSARMALSTASTVTPTSANTASHIVAIPRAARTFDTHDSSTHKKIPYRMAVWDFL